MKHWMWASWAAIIIALAVLAYWLPGSGRENVDMFARVGVVLTAAVSLANLFSSRIDVARKRQVEEDAKKPVVRVERLRTPERGRYLLTISIKNPDYEDVFLRRIELKSPPRLGIQSAYDPKRHEPLPLDTPTISLNPYAANYDRALIRKGSAVRIKLMLEYYEEAGVSTETDIVLGFTFEFDTFKAEPFSFDMPVVRDDRPA